MSQPSTKSRRKGRTNTRRQHRRNTTRAIVRSGWLYAVENGYVRVPDPAPLFSPLRLANLRKGLTGRECRLAEQRALRKRLGFEVER